MQLLTVFILICVYVGVGSLVRAESAFGLPEAGLTPESPVYFLDLWDEDLRLFFARSDISRYRRYEGRVLERLSEAEALAGRGISATQRALELYRMDLPFFYTATERLGDLYRLETALQMATDHLDVLDRVSERTEYEKKRFIPQTKIFLIEQQLQTLHALAKQDPSKALAVFGEALQRRMTRIRDVAIDDENNAEAIEEYAAYMSEVDRVLREWEKARIEELSPADYLAQIVRTHEETLLGPVRERLAATLETELLQVVNNVRKLSGEENLLALPPVPDPEAEPYIAPTTSGSTDSASPTSTPGNTVPVPVPKSSGTGSAGGSGSGGSTGGTTAPPPPPPPSMF